MYRGLTIITIIPALNEAQSIEKVIGDIPSFVDRILVVDNGSDDDTARIAQAAGSEVITEPKRGYGQACLTGLAQVKNEDVIVFLDGDYSDDPKELEQLLIPLSAGTHDFALSTRLTHPAARSSLTPAQVYGNRLACFLMNRLWQCHYTDLGPFRAIMRSQLDQLAMRDTNYGWTIEMQIKAAQKGLRIVEIPLTYRQRIGHSKISGTISGTLKAGSKILLTIARFYWAQIRKKP